MMRHKLFGCGPNGKLAGGQSRSLPCMMPGMAQPPEHPQIYTFEGLIWCIISSPIHNIWALKRLTIQTSVGAAANLGPHLGAVSF